MCGRLRSPSAVTTARQAGAPWSCSARSRADAVGARGEPSLVTIGRCSIICRSNAPIPTASASFYDAVLAPLGGGRVLDFGTVIGYGVAGRPTFWIGPLNTGEPNREVHVAFEAADRATVRAFFTTAVAAGAEVLHEPREWPEYHPNYYGAFVRDPDGNNVEAVCHAARVGAAAV